MIGFMRGNHTFRIFHDRDEAVREIESGICAIDAHLYEMAFIGHGERSVNLHRDMHESDSQFVDRAKRFFAMGCLPNKQLGIYRAVSNFWRKENPGAPHHVPAVP